MTSNNSLLKISVSRPFLPPLEEYQQLVSKIFKRQWLTNHGPLVTNLEERLKDYLKVSYLSFVTNGTVALQLAYRALELKGDVITTPFTYVATISSLSWENCNPIFVDIDPESFNIDPGKIAAAITSKTTAIVATHVFGNPCDVIAIQGIAESHGLNVVYDAAHAFGVTIGGKNICLYGDISTLSFHATKLFHTVEGGAVISNSPENHYRVNQLKNFGHKGYDEFDGIGINGKNSEFHAAMGLCNLSFVDQILQKYQSLYVKYLSHLSSCVGLRFQHIFEDCFYNHAYFPVVFESEKQLNLVKKKLEEQLIFPRRYFYPSLDTLEYVQPSDCPVARGISKTILCLPMFFELRNEDVDRICEIVIKSISKP